MSSKESNATTAHKLKRLFYNHPRTDEDLLQELQKSFEAQHTTQALPPLQYTGQRNRELHTPFAIQEIEAAIHGLTRNATPGQDEILSKRPRNLDPITLKNLLTYMNEQSMKRTLPPQ